MSKPTFPWKVCNPQGECLAQTAYADDAAALVSVIGGEVRHRTPTGDVVWTEGDEEFGAGESYSGAAEVMHKRVAAIRRDQRRERAPALSKRRSAP